MVKRNSFQSQTAEKSLSHSTKRVKSPNAHPSELVQIIVYQLAVGFDESSELVQVSRLNLLELLGSSTHLLLEVVPRYNVFVGEYLKKISRNSCLALTLQRLSFKHTCIRSGPLTQCFSVSLFVKYHWFARWANPSPLVGEIFFSSLTPSNSFVSVLDP